MINKQLFQFPINYGNTWMMGKIAFGWEAHKKVHLLRSANFGARADSSRFLTDNPPIC